MRVYSQKSLKFDDPAGQEAPVFVQALSFADVPEWVKKSTMFQWATEEGTLTVVDSKAQEASAEAGGNDTALKLLKARAKELGVAGYTKMNAEQLLAAIESAQKTPNPQADPPSDPPQDPPVDPPAN